jgi:BCD family chlorophyll transporter-like MFS transporter
MSGALGSGMATPFAGYSFVYHIEIGLLLLTIIAIGPLVRVGLRSETRTEFGLSEFPT